MAADVLERVRGKFIVFDGIDGAGKGAQIRLFTEALGTSGIPFVATRDPGGTPVGDRIRHVLLDYDLSQMDVRCETLLFMASRAQLLHDVVEPALADGKTVVCDRFVSATCAYQGAAGYDPRQVIELARFAIGRTWPHLTFVLDLPVDEGANRTGRAARQPRPKEDVPGQVRLFHDTHADSMERRPSDFHERVRELFLKLPEIYPAPVVVIDGRGEVNAVHTRIMEALARATL